MNTKHAENVQSVLRCQLFHILVIEYSLLKKYTIDLLNQVFQAILETPN